MINIYGTNRCMYCRLSKELCKQNKISYRFYDINELKHRHQINEYKKKKVIPKTHISMPVIFVKNKFIGGFAELDKILAKKSIRQLLRTKISKFRHTYRRKSRRKITRKK